MQLRGLRALPAAIEESSSPATAVGQLVSMLEESVCNLHQKTFLRSSGDDLEKQHPKTSLWNSGDDLAKQLRKTFLRSSGDGPVAWAAALAAALAVALAAALPAVYCSLAAALAAALALAEQIAGRLAELPAGFLGIQTDLHNLVDTGLHSLGTGQLAAAGHFHTCTQSAHNVPWLSRHDTKT